MLGSVNFERLKTRQGSHFVHKSDHLFIAILSDEPKRKKNMTFLYMWVHFWKYYFFVSFGILGSAI